MIHHVPHFSIILPAYKTRYLKECIDCVLAQTYPHWELVIVNDASPENVRSIVEQYNDPRIRYYENGQNFGAERLVEQWNHCLSLAKKDYIICIGDDDMIAPQGLKIYRDYIDQYPQVAVLHGQTDVIDEKGNLLSHTAKRPVWESAMSLLYNRTYHYHHQFVGDFCYRRKDLIAQGGFYYLPYAWGSDDITALLAAKENGIANTQEVVFLYRDNRHSITRSAHPLGKIKAILREMRWKRQFTALPCPNQEDEKKRKELRRGLCHHTLKKIYYVLRHSI